MENKSVIWLSAGLGVISGFILFGLVRGFFFFPEPVHYHANFGIFINGEREQFDGFGYYEEIQACTEDYATNPRSRVHLHQPDNDVVHVHDAGATWGNLLENLDWSISQKALQSETEIWIDGQGGTLSLILNGENVPSVANLVIQDQDRLLISYGDPQEAQSQYEQIPATAGTYNQTPDPASCAGSDSASLWDRLRYGFTGQA